MPLVPSDDDDDDGGGGGGATVVVVFAGDGDADEHGLHGTERNGENASRRGSQLPRHSRRPRGYFDVTRADGDGLVYRYLFTGGCALALAYYFTSTRRNLETIFFSEISILRRS